MSPTVALFTAALAMGHVAGSAAFAQTPTPPGKPSPTATMPVLARAIAKWNLRKDANPAIDREKLRNSSAESSRPTWRSPMS